MTTFALVHGASHGAWFWERLMPEIEALGHRVITMDLPVDDRSATFGDYADTVCAAITDVPGDELILVGHSLAGVVVPLVATCARCDASSTSALWFRFPGNRSHSRWPRTWRCSTPISRKAWRRGIRRIAGRG